MCITPEGFGLVANLSPPPLRYAALGGYDIGTPSGLG